MHEEIVGRERRFPDGLWNVEKLLERIEDSILVPVVSETTFPTYAYPGSPVLMG